MSYTMTLDVPQKTAEYVGARPHLREELNAIFIAIVAAKMRCEEADDGVAETPGPSLLDAIREADEIADGRRDVKWFKSVEELAADCLA